MSLLSGPFCASSIALTELYSMGIFVRCQGDYNVTPIWLPTATFNNSDAGCYAHGHLAFPTGKPPELLQPICRILQKHKHLGVPCSLSLTVPSSAHDQANFACPALPP